MLGIAVVQRNHRVEHLPAGDESSGMSCHSDCGTGEELALGTLPEASRSTTRCTRLWTIYPVLDFMSSLEREQVLSPLQDTGS